MRKRGLHMRERLTFNRIPFLLPIFFAFLLLSATTAKADIEILDTSTNQVVGSTPVDMGAAVVSRIANRVFLITNTGPTSALIEDCEVINDNGQGPNGFFISASPIPPGESSFYLDKGLSTSIGVGFSALQVGTYSATVRCFNFSFRVTARAITDAATLQVTTAQGTPIAPGSLIDFGIAQVGASVDQTFVINNNGFQTLTPTVVVSGTGFSLFLKPLANVPGAGHTSFTVRFNSVITGSFTGTVMVQSNDPTNNSFTFNVTGTCQSAPAPRLRVVDNTPPSPSVTVTKGDRVDYGFVAAGSIVTHNFEVWNDGNAPLAVSNPSALLSGPPSFMVSSTTNLSTIQAGGMGSFAVQYRGDASGLASANVSIASNDSGNNPFTFQLNATSLGSKLRITAGQVTVASFAEVTLPHSPYGVPVSQVFTVWNDGTTPLVLADLIDSATPSFTISDFPTAPIAPLGNKNFTITFNAIRVGAAHGQYVFSTNDSTLPTFVLAVTANGDGAIAVVLDPEGATLNNGSSYTFPSTPANTPVAPVFTITNRGDLPLTISGFTLSAPGGGFTLLTTPISPIQNNIGTSQIQLLSSVPGTYTGTVSFNTNDPALPTYTFHLQGTVTAGNLPPVANPDAATTSQGTAVTVDVVSNDSDPNGDSLRVVAIVTPPTQGTATISSRTQILYTPNPSFFGTDSLVYQIGDGNGGRANGTLTITVLHVNHIPVANPDSATTNEDTPISINVTANDTDADGDALSLVSILTPPTNGTAAITSASTVLYTPNPNFNGTDSFHYRISDGHGGLASAIVTVTVNPVNDPPVANPDSATTNQGAPVTVNVVANDTDVDGDGLRVVAIVTPPGQGTAAISSPTQILYTPNPSFFGTDSLVYQIGDGNGGRANGTLSITVLHVNHIPVANPDSVTTNEDTPISINVTANDTDADGDALVVGAILTPPTHGTATIASASNVLYTPAPNFNGTDTFRYRISDGQGGVTSAVVTVTVTPVNDPPVANPDSATTAKNTAVNIIVTANDTDVDGDALTVVSVVTAPAHGSAAIVNSSTIRYTPATNFVGNDSFVYQIGDGNGHRANATVTVTVH